MNMLSVSGAFCMEWTEFSCELKPASGDSVGVFATHDIPAGTLLFNNPKGHIIRILRKSDIPQNFLEYCIQVNDDEYLCPERFDRMEMGWYINYYDEPNIAVKKDVKKDSNNVIAPHLYATKDIKAGEEILIAHIRDDNAVR